ncbi:MAG: Gfo/Idh/MocA family oxidoreductase [Caldilineaceae bacterium SB0675_bin_29]|uniref:Gfo/Idh/MocA family oxidoreductase n=1 Tax=Caldilineaceae bacterium SB0675_bin_29 TaxID=2605266 RepID=A0A6B1FWF9_9CHLR|nr:Gfo/Idh/MocA family oxidoreductase [Caldilineaceae bacterium SB0675_bin_29]
MDKIRWGILGTGRIAGDFATGLAAESDAEIVAVGSRAQHTADEFADRFAIPNRHPSYDALAADPDVDIIYIATPHTLHKENTISCLNAGKAVLCEKPFAINSAEAQDMIDCARAHGIFLMEAMWTRFLPHIRDMVRRIEEGQIGDIRLFQGDFCYRAPVNPASRAFNPDLGGGALLDIGVYPISLVHHLLGGPARIASFAHLGETGVDELAGMLFQYEDGALAVMSTAVRANTPHSLLISGTQGEIRADARWWAPSGFTISRDGYEPETVRPDIIGNGWNYQAVECGRCLREGLTEHELLPHDESRAIMRLMDGLREDWGLRYPME